MSQAAGHPGTPRAVVQGNCKAAGPGAPSKWGGECLCLHNQQWVVKKMRVCSPGWVSPWRRPATGHYWSEAPLTAEDGALCKALSPGSCEVVGPWGTCRRQ